ncbi:Uncharacterized protein FWK35_00028838 [Aphis craccivora]|uniref:Uncharacterized protein n=1 Tax=Aphis craccivora TaxID=307492 RepID=A0A6G0ZCU1_APHCR|nr:Uncharacterized protein FWK35_00028838 [Aphis craccivora]
MPIGEIKCRPEIYERTANVTKKLCPGLVQIVTDSSSNTAERNHEDLGRPPALRERLSGDRRARCSAGSDNSNSGGRNNPCSRNPSQQNGRSANNNDNNNNRPNWGNRDDARLPPLRLAFRDSSLARPAQQQQQQQQQQTRPSRIPVPCPCQPEQPRRQDRPVDLYTGSRLPVPNRPGRAPTRIPRRGACDAQPAASRTCAQAAAPADRRCTYDVQPAPSRPCAQAAVPTDRRGTYDVQPPPCGDQNSRRCTFTVQPDRQQRRDTYDVPQPCAALQGGRRNSCMGQPAGCGGSPSNLTGTFTLTGTIRLDGFPGLSPPRQQQQQQQQQQASPPRGRSSSCGRLNNNNNNTDAAINDFLDNQDNCDMVAPRSMAVPGQPYVRIDENAGTATPERWRQMMDNRSSIGSQPMGIMSPAYDEYRGSCDTSADSSRLTRWSSSDRQSRPFGLHDSFNVNGASSSTPCDRPSRPRSAAPDCAPRNRCRRDTFDRNTR